MDEPRRQTASIKLFRSSNTDIATGSSDEKMVQTRARNYGTIVSKPKQLHKAKSSKPAVEKKARVVKTPAQPMSSIKSNKSTVKTPVKTTQASSAKSPAKSLAISPVKSLAKSPAKQPTKSPSKSPAKPSGEDSASKDDSLHYTIVEKYQSDIFKDAPQNSVLIHACNCRGSWGAGIAKTFAQKYPKAYVIYQKHCKGFSSNPSQLRGTALLIPPVDNVEKPIWIGCLFTSVGVGMNTDSTNQILKATETSMNHLMSEYMEARGNQLIGDVFMCKINSGLFRVPWHRTRDVLEKPEVFVTGSAKAIHLLALGPEDPRDKRK